MHPNSTALAAAIAILVCGAGTALAAGEPVIGLITKTETNPFFVKMKEGATAKAKELGVKILSEKDFMDLLGSKPKPIQKKQANLF